MIRIPNPVALTVLAFGILCSRALPAQEHPVPLEAGVDAAKCLECHEDKSKGKNVHSAIAMGCTSCHEVKTAGETTKIELNQPADQLCFTCHSNDAKPEDSKHVPWEKGQCVLCHDPHVSEYPKQLRADGNQLCMECHKSRGPQVPEQVKIFGSHDMPRDEFRGARKLGLNREGDRGHPLGNHWVATFPDLTRSDGQKMTCLTCHVSHTSPEDKLGRMLTVKDAAGKDLKVDACNVCHLELDKRVAEQRAQAAPAVERQIQQQQIEAQKKREEYLKKLPKLAGDERDQQK